jgi:hypothetical protein
LGNFFILLGWVRQPAAKLPPVTTTPVENFSTSFFNLPRYWRQIVNVINDAGGKFSTGVNDTGGNQWEQLSNC